MIERGDYIVPYFNNQLRLDKPPLTYWAQAVSYRVFGENDFAARFPSAIAAALTAMVIFAWGMRLGGEKLGWWAAIVFTLSLQTFVHAKAAVADMWLVLFVTLAHWSGYELLRDQFFKKDQRPTFNVQRPTPNSEGVEAPALRRVANGWWWVFYAALAFAFLAKGPIGWIPLLTVTSAMIWLREPGLARHVKFRSEERRVGKECRSGWSRYE